MRQKLIEALIDEAVRTHDPNRRDAIKRQLLAAVFPLDNLRVQGIRILLAILWNSTIQHRPSYLRKLLPFFILVCGDREEGALTGEINWQSIGME